MLELYGSKQGCTNGWAVLPELAMWFDQLYVDPHSPGSSELYQSAVRQGIVKRRDLSHFSGSPADSAVIEMTAAGPILMVTLSNRSDFVTAVEILAGRCREFRVPDHMGALFLQNVVCRGKLRRYMESDFAKNEDFYEKSRRIAINQSIAKENLILLSTGPYCGLPEDSMGLSREEWIRRSQTIRTVHERTHFVLRSLFPTICQDRLCEEVIADAAGLVAAFGTYSEDLASLFMLGSSSWEGRIHNYILEQESLEDAACHVREIISWTGTQIEPGDMDTDAYALRLANAWIRSS